MCIATSIAPPFLVQSVALVVAAAAIAYVCYRIGLVPIVGFLVAGVVIGPSALGVVSDPALVNAAAEFGVILLLFTIGIEFSLDKLARITTLIFGGGGLQVLLASVLTMLVLLPFGVDWRPALFTGFLVSLSSTAIVLKLLADRGESGTTFGQVSLGLLIFQDLAIVVMVLLVPMLAGAGGSGLDLAAALGKALAIILAVLLVARRLMPPLLERVARTCSPELFLLTVIAICFGTAWLTSVAGVSLSLGAFLAGLLVSESRFSHHAFGEIMPLQILFSAVFFVSVGMLLDLDFLLHHLPMVLGARPVRACGQEPDDDGERAGTGLRGAGGGGLWALAGADRRVLVRARSRGTGRRAVAGRPGRNRVASVHRRVGDVDGGHATAGFPWGAYRREARETRGG